MPFQVQLGLDLEEERALVAGMLAGSSEALERLLEAHMPLARTMVRRYRRRFESNEDLWAEARLALLVAARRFDPSHQVRFASYATFWVRAYVRRCALRDALPVGLPGSRRARRLLAELPALRRRLEQLYRREPTADELAHELGVGADEVANLQEVMRGRSLSVDELPCETASPEELALAALQRDHLHEAIHGALAQLSERDRHIVRRRWLEEEQATLTSIGHDLGISRERVRQLERRAKGKLQQTLAALA